VGKIQKIENLIRDGLVESAISEIVDDIEKGNPYYNDIILQSSRFSNVKRSHNNGLLSQEQYSIEVNKINNAVLELGKKIYKIEASKKTSYARIIIGSLIVLALLAGVFFVMNPAEQKASNQTTEKPEAKPNDSSKNQPIPKLPSFQMGDSLYLKKTYVIGYSEISNQGSQKDENGHQISAISSEWKVVEGYGIIDAFLTLTNNASEYLKINSIKVEVTDFSSFNKDFDEESNVDKGDHPYFKEDVAFSYTFSNEVAKTYSASNFKQIVCPKNKGKLVKLELTPAEMGAYDLDLIVEYSIGSYNDTYRTSITKNDKLLFLPENKVNN